MFDYLKKYIKRSIQGTNKKDINLDDLTHRYGKVFSIVFNILLFGFSIQMLILFILGLFQLNIFMLGFSLIISYILFHCIRKEILPRALFIMFAWSPFALILYILLPMLNSIVVLKDFFVYFFVALHSLVLGVVLFYMFSKVLKKPIRYVLTGTKYLCLLAFVFANNQFIKNIILLFSSQNSESSIKSGLSQFFTLLNTQIANQYIGFLVAFVFFLIPMLYFYKGYKKRKYSYLLFLIVPVVLFLMLTVLFGFILNLLF